jgi:hypothetical protein
LGKQVTFIIIGENKLLLYHRGKQVTFISWRKRVTFISW